MVMVSQGYAKRGICANRQFDPLTALKFDVVTDPNGQFET
jgi:hypothetical protein